MANRSQAMQGYMAQPGMSQASYNPLLQMERIGGQRTAQSQSELNAAIMAHEQRQAAPIEAINNYMALVGSAGGQFGQSMTSQRSNPGLLGILGGIGQIAPLFGLSDIRAKTDIRRVGETNGGTGPCDTGKKP